MRLFIQVFVSCICCSSYKPPREETPSMCAQRRLKSACAIIQSYLSIRCPNEEALHHWLSKNALRDDSVQTARIRRLIWPRDYKTFFMLNSAEHEVCPANKSQITNNCIFFLAKHENFSANKYENANYCWHFHIY